MIKTIKKHKYKFLVVTLLAVIGILIVLLTNKDMRFEVKSYFYGTNLTYASKITCTYPQLLSASYLQNEVTHELPVPETNPLIFTFSDFSEENPQMSYIDATRTITTIPVIKIIDNEEKMVFLDGGAENYLSTHTIYKENGIATYTKNVSLLGNPLASLAMGTCSGY